MFEKFFKLSEHGTTVKTEILAGITTFLTMGYILIVNPIILSKTGMPFGAIITATALSSAIATLVMALYANMPFGLAPGMGLNAFFAFTVVLGMGYSWEFALTAVFLEGVIFLILTFLNVREAIVNSIPINLKYAISAGIGLFIAFIGFQGAGVVVDNPAVLVGLGSMLTAKPMICVFGLLVIGVLHYKKVKGALMIGIFASTILALILGVAKFNGIFSTPASLAPIMMKLDFSNVFSLDMATVLFTFLFVDMFDTVGTLVGVASKANMLDADGKLPGVKKALFADAVGTTVGAMLGTCTVTTYVESAAGVEEGGRTGLTALTIAALFLLSLFISPLITMVPGAATAPVLIVVGVFMLTPILKVNFDDFTEGLPAFLAMAVMPLTYSISEGIAFGVISYAALKLCTGKGKEVSLVTYIVALIFIGKFFM